MQPKRGMGPFMALGKRPGTSSCAPPMGRRPTLIAFPRALVRLSTDIAAIYETTREARLRWRYRA